MTSSDSSPTYDSRRTSRPARLGMVIIALALPLAMAPAPARADTVAYLVNVTVRPGYNFPNADEALDYGYGLCDRIANGSRYEAVMAGVSVDFNTTDEYQSAYLINQAINELCPQYIWQLRQSAAGYQPAVR